MRKEEFDGDRIFVVHDFLSPEECRQLIQRAEGIGFDEAPITTARGFEMRKDIRNNTRVMFDDIDLARQFWERLQPFVPSPFGGRVAKELNERFRFYRYTVGEKFAPHLDGYFARDNGDKSRFTFMVYLNEDCLGGNTRFLEPLEYEIKPVIGKALLFYHHQLHEGVEVRKGVKYVLRTDVMYAG